jgi:coenzyme F420-0:L-glutamate ligase / coenzyme F420-1:gamma-L-glutamate ligase
MLMPGYGSPVSGTSNSLLRSPRGELRVIPVPGLPEIREGDDLAAIVAGASDLHDGDVVVVAHKVVSKAEGRVVLLDDIEPSARARELAADEDPRRLEVILHESVRLVRTRPPLVIAETRHGFVCASAGVDSSNAPGAGTVVLLPEDPDASAERLRNRLKELTGRDVAVIVSDSFGRAWRQGTTDIAIGCAGLRPLLDLHGERDATGYELHATVIAVADELAGAAELVRGKLDRVPVAIVRGFGPSGDGKARELVMPPDRDLFR